MKERIKEFLQKRGITKVQFARLLDVQPSAVSGWLSGDRQIAIKHVERIAYLLQLPDDADLLYFPDADLLKKKIQKAPVMDKNTVQKAVKHVLDEAVKYSGVLFPADIMLPNDREYRDFFSGLSIVDLSKIIEIASSVMARNSHLLALPIESFVHEVLCEQNLGHGSDFEVELNKNGHAYISIYFNMDGHTIDLESAYWANVHADDSVDQDDFGDRSFDEIVSSLKLSAKVVEETHKHAFDETRSHFGQYVTDMGRKIFEGTVFVPDVNSQWIYKSSPNSDGSLDGENIYMLSYEAKWDSPGFRDSMVIAAKRFKRWA